MLSFIYFSTICSILHLIVCSVVLIQFCFCFICRLDGKTESSERQRIVVRFNEPSNKRVKCTLISTRAGSLGINLYAANRVVIVDGSWNPTHDLQAIYRAWRFVSLSLSIYLLANSMCVFIVLSSACRYGQTKPVFAYRLLAYGTMEEKIYKRQVTESIDRVEYM